MIPTILAVDPGKVTGVAAWQPSEPMKLTTWEEHTRYRAAAAVEHIMPSELVCEQFVISERTIRTAQDVNALRIIGWLDIWCRQKAIPFDLQTAAQAKRFATDDKLKALGWYTSTEGGHANDAARHMLVYLQRKHPAVFREILLPVIKDVL